MFYTNCYPGKIMNNVYFTLGMNSVMLGNIIIINNWNKLGLSRALQPSVIKHCNIPNTRQCNSDPIMVDNLSQTIILWKLKHIKFILCLFLQLIYHLPIKHISNIKKPECVSFFHSFILSFFLSFIPLKFSWAAIG